MGADAAGMASLPRAGMVERGRDVVAGRFDPTYVLLDKVDELRTRESRVRNMVVGLLRTPDARRNPWRDQLFAVLRVLDGEVRDAAA